MLIKPLRTTKKRLVVRATRRYKDSWLGNTKIPAQDAEWLTNIILIKCRSHSKVNILKIWEKLIGWRVAFPKPNPNPLPPLWLFPDNEGCGLLEGVDCGLSRILGGCVALFFDGLFTQSKT